MYLERMPQQPVEPRETKYNPAMTCDEENALLDEFCKDYYEEFIQYIKDYDPSLLSDFAGSINWKWNRFKEENREYQQ